MAVNDNSLRSSIWTEVKALLDAASLEYYNNANPQVSVTGVKITGAYIDEDKAFPQVVINNTDVAKDNFAFDKTNNTNNIQVMLDIYTKKAINQDYITDQIDNISGLKNIQGLMFTGWEESKAYSPENENKIHLKTITLNYKRR